jgi:hypothetical protein
LNFHRSRASQTQAEEQFKKSSATQVSPAGLCGGHDFRQVDAGAGTIGLKAEKKGVLCDFCGFLSHNRFIELYIF